MRTSDKKEQAPVHHPCHDVEPTRKGVPSRIVEGTRQPARVVFRMGVARRALLSVALALVLAAVGAFSQTDTAAPALDTILTRMEQARNQNRANFLPYTVTRDYTLFGKDGHSVESQVSAHVTFLTPDSITFVIDRAGGTALGEKVARRMLETETAFAKAHLSSDISQDNYAFRLVGEESVGGVRCYRLELVPKNTRNKNLLRGDVWVDANTYLIRRMEGVPAKKSTPWWIRDVRVAALYGETNGMWVCTSSKITASVTLLGARTMTTRGVTYALAWPQPSGQPSPSSESANR